MAETADEFGGGFWATNGSENGSAKLAEELAAIKSETIRPGNTQELDSEGILAFSQQLLTKCDQFWPLMQIPQQRVLQKTISPRDCGLMARNMEPSKLL